MKTSLQKQNGQGTGFSVIELVGVLAIIAILAAAAAPTFIKRTDHEAKTAEQQTLKRFSEGLLLAVLKSNQIPATAIWPQTIASSLECSPSLVSVNPRLFPRAFVAHPSFSVNGFALPYTQGSSGSATAPANAQAMILSTVAVALPDLSSITAADFNNIWTTAEGTIPTAMSSWTGRAEDLVIERIEFTPLFHRVLLVNVDPAPHNGYFSINTHSMVWVVPEAQFAGYYLDGTVINFIKTNVTAGAISLDTSEVVRADTSFLYKKIRWGRRLGGSDDVDDPFGELVTEFMKGPPPSDPKFAATQQAVVNEMYSYLWAFSAWSIGDPSTNYLASGTNIFPAVPQFESETPNYPFYARTADAQVLLETFTNNLIH